MKFYPGDIVVSLFRGDRFRYKILDITPSGAIHIEVYENGYRRRDGKQADFHVQPYSIALHSSFLQAVREACEKGLDEERNGP